MFNKKIVAIVFISLMVLSILVVGLANVKKTVDPVVSVADVRSNLSSYEHHEFVSCLNDLGVQVFISKTCPHCSEQKDLFGEVFWGLNYTDCYFDKEFCSATEGLVGVPSWYFNNTMYPGVHSLESLSELTGCSLE